MSQHQSTNNQNNGLSLPESLAAIREAYLRFAKLSPDQISKNDAASAALQTAGLAAQDLNSKLRDIDLASRAPESTRPPQGLEPQKISLDRTVVLLKRSKLSYDMDTLGLSREQTIEHYRTNSPEDADKIIAADQTHSASIEALRKIYTEAGVQERFMVLDSFDAPTLAKALSDVDLVISLGGDDHFKSVARHVTDQLVLVLNSDAQRSVGALTYFNEAHFEKVFAALRAGNFLVEEWSRISATVRIPQKNGEKVITPTAACSELHVADKFSDYTMRGLVDHYAVDGTIKRTFPLKGTGVLIATGAGSTGWFHSAGLYCYPEGHPWNRTDQRLEYIAREPYGVRGPWEFYNGTVLPGEKLVVRSTSNHTPLVSGDSVWAEPLPRGSTATIELAAAPLKIISNQGI